MKNPIKRLPVNEHGRDFVIGDLHGSLECLLKLMEAVNFDPSKDRIISVGDLVDRGPDSAGCLELLKEPWFHCVLANHEQMMLEAFDGGYLGQFWLKNGGFWGYTALQEYQDSKRHITNELDRKTPSPASVSMWECLQLVRELPFLITVELPGDKLVHVIHAELPPGHLITDAILSSPEKVRELAMSPAREGDYFLWGRHTFMSFYDTDLSNVAKLRRTVAYQHKVGGMFNDKLSHIISGHTIMQRPLTILGQTNIDTKAYGACKSPSDRRKWNALTALELKTWTFHQATLDEYRIVDPVVVNTADIQAVPTQSRTPLIDALNQGQP